MSSMLRRPMAALLAVSLLALSSLAGAQPQGPRDFRGPHDARDARDAPDARRHGAPHPMPPGQAGRGPHRMPPQAQGHGPQWRPSPPPQAYVDRGRGAGPDHNWRRGGRVPPQYRSHHYVVNDWRGHHLSAPPRGYHWVQYGSDYLLVAIATGVIAQLILGQ